MFTQHPSPELNDWFAAKPYQGVAPEKAAFLFIGLDANYAEGIDNSPVFPKLREYHTDGAAFWRRYGVHHPFLLPEYAGDGRFYHQSFARIGFGPQHAELVSFLELMPLPTVGRSKLTPTDLSDSHLAYVSSAILDGNAAHIFVPSGVARLMHASKAFRWLPKSPSPKSGPLTVLYLSPTKVVYSHLHFSVYGKFQARKVEEAAAIHRLLTSTYSRT